MAASADRFLGVWELIPELSLYAVGTPPSSGRYTIVQNEAGALELSVRWRMPGSDREGQTQFGGRADGSRVSLPLPPDASPSLPDALSLTRVDASTLDSAAFRGDDEIAFARRRVSDDGALMSVVQESRAADGARTRNFQVYRRIVRSG